MENLTELNDLENGLMSAVRAGNFEIANFLIRGGIKFRREGLDSGIIADMGFLARYPMKADRVVDEEALFQTFDHIFGIPDLFPLDKNGNNLLYMSTKHHFPLLAKWAVNRAEDPKAFCNQRNNSGLTPFHATFEFPSRSDTTEIACVMSPFVNLDEPNKKGRFPLESSSDRKRIEHFIALGANPFLRNLDGQTLKEVVCRNISGGEELFQNNGFSEHPYETLVLHGAGTKEELQRAFARGPYDTPGELTGETALFHACRTGKLDNVKWLLSKNADIFRKSNDGRSPLGVLLCTVSPSQKTALKKKEIIQPILLAMNDDQRENTIKAFFLHVAQNGIGEDTSSKTRVSSKTDYAICETLVMETSHEIIARCAKEIAMATTKTWRGEHGNPLCTAVLQRLESAIPVADHESKTIIANVLVQRFSSCAYRWPSNSSLANIMELDVDIDEEMLKRCLKRVSDKKSNFGTERLCESIQGFMSRQDARKLMDKTQSASMPKRQSQRGI